jgi:hypothetical protein
MQSVVKNVYHEELKKTIIETYRERERDREREREKRVEELK